MFRRIILFLFAISVFIPLDSAIAADAKDHAPIGVMGDHNHKQGEWMASYVYMHMDMPKNYSGTNELSAADVHNEFMISPIDMTMDMHMVGMMYGVTDDITAMLMLPYVIKEMDHRRRTDGRQFTTNSDGPGDVALTGMFFLKRIIELPVHLNFGISFPTGSINEKDDTLAGPNQILPYPMQPGSGTFAVLPGITYFDQYYAWSWGFQDSAAIQIGRNEYKYQLGDSHELTAWIAYAWDEWVSTSLRIQGSIWGDISGADQRLNPNMVPTANPDLRGGERIDLFLGMNLLGHEGIFNEHRLALEIGYPVYQSLDGPQLGMGVQGTVGWQRAW